jgi:thiol-disulfide isomerase/thioredoxin
MIERLSVFGSSASNRLTVLVAGAALVLTVGCVRLPQLPEDPVPAVRDAVAKGDFEAAGAVLENYQLERGTRPELVEGYSVLALELRTAKRNAEAAVQARMAYDLASKLLLARPVDQEPRVPLGLGRAIEIMARTSVEHGTPEQALHFLEGELHAYRGTSLEKRIQRNINLITLEGAEAPALDVSEHLGAPSPSLASLKGQVVLLFFWAHYCADCKSEAPILGRIVDKYRAQGLTLVAPTQRYGYVAEGTDATPADEKAYIAEVQRTYYPVLSDVPIPLSEANHRRYGVSSTPTIVLVNRQGRVALYHPGTMTEAELDAAIRPLLAGDTRAS